MSLSITAQIASQEEPVVRVAPVGGHLRDVVAHGPQEGVLYRTRTRAGMRSHSPRPGRVRIEIDDEFGYADLCELNAFVFALLSWVRADKTGN